MKKILLVFTIAFLFLTGCSSKTNTVDKKNSEVPPPYTLAIEAIENYDFQRATEMLDLTIKDFPDNDFVYHANILKYSILSSQWATYMSIADAHIEKAPSSAFLKESKKCLAIAEKYLSLANSVMTQQQPIIDYLQNNYTGITISFDIRNYKPKDSTEFTSMLGWVRNVGFPDSEEAIERKTKDALTEVFYVALFSYFGEENKNNIKPLTGTISYPALFLNLGLSASDSNLSDKCFQKVIELTSDDKYNKHRLNAEKMLKEESDKNN